MELINSDCRGTHGSVPQNICSSDKFLQAGRFGKSNMSLSRHTEYCKADFWKESVAV